MYNLTSEKSLFSGLNTLSNLIGIFHASINFVAARKCVKHAPPDESYRKIFARVFGRRMRRVALLTKHADGDKDNGPRSHPLIFDADIQFRDNYQQFC
jgi:hypothetical protein